jgi:hypothetical protein
MITARECPYWKGLNGQTVKCHCSDADVAECKKDSEHHTAKSNTQSNPYAPITQEKKR